MSNQPRYIAHFADSDAMSQLKLDRIGRQLRDLNVNYVVTYCDALDVQSAPGRALWITSKINNAFHAELKARALGIIFTLDHDSDMVGFPQAQELNFVGQFVTLPSEEVKS